MAKMYTAKCIQVFTVGVVLLAMMERSAFAESIDAGGVQQETAQEKVAKAEKEVEVAKKEAEIAKKEAAQAAATQQKERADETQSVLDQVRGSKLISLGITGGVAATAIIPLGVNSIDTPLAVVAMPYVAFYPAYWVNATGATNQYCATTFIGTDSVEARASANRVERGVSKDKLDTYLAKVSRMDGTAKGLGELSGIVQFCAEEQPSLKPEQLAARRWLCSQLSEPDAAKKFSVETSAQAQAAVIIHRATVEQRSMLRNEWIVQDADARWVAHVGAKCGWNRIGGYVGIPLPAKVDVRTGQDKFEESQLTSYVSAGLTLAPNAYVQAMVGYSIGKIAIPGANASSEPYTFHALTVGVGGNLDILGAITAK